MLKTTLLLGLTLCLAGLTIPLATPSVHAGSPPPTAEPAAQTATIDTPPTVEPPVAQPSQPEDDPWFAPLRGRVEQLSDAYMDTPHVSRGIRVGGEPTATRTVRLDAFTHDVLGAVRARAGELAQFGPDAAWKYAVTLACIAHKETRISSNPSKLGDQDNGKAAGYWQIWERRDHADRFSAATALDMLVHEPTSSWSLPKNHPWTGYPDCAKWLAAHPAPGIAAGATAP